MLISINYYVWAGDSPKVSALRIKTFEKTLNPYGLIELEGTLEIISAKPHFADTESVYKLGYILSRDRLICVLPVFCAHWPFCGCVLVVGLVCEF